MKSNCLVPRDGLVIATNTYEKVLAKLPKQKIAFKIVGETALVTVIEVEWNGSKNQLLKPRIHFDTVVLEKGQCSWVTGHNAAFIRDYKVGPGTEMIISRDIIANIVSVPKQTEASLPVCDYTWNKTGVDIVCDMNEQIEAKRIYIFFESLSAKYLGLKTVNKLYEGGYKDVNSLLVTTHDKMCQLDGFQKTGVTRIMNSIQGTYQKATLVDVMFGSCLFPNFGKIKLQTIIDTIPKIYDILLYDKDDVVTIEELQRVAGVKTMANGFLSNINTFKKFLSQIPTMKQALINNYQKNNTPMVEIVSSLVSSNITTPPLLIPDECNDKPLVGMFIVFTGDKKMTDITKGLGAVVQSGINKNTTLVVVNNIGDNTNKEVTAKTRGIPIMSLKDFKQKHLNM